MPDDKVASELAAICDRLALVNAPLDGHLLDAHHDALIQLAGGDLPRLLAGYNDLLKLHAPLLIWDECDHAHTDDDVDSGRAVDTGEFVTCTESWLYAICHRCCAEPDGLSQSEECASTHEHSPDDAICASAAVISRALLGEDGADGQA
jgi:hypothetical protein